MSRRVLLAFSLVALPFAGLLSGMLKPAASARAATTSTPSLPDLGPLPELTGGTQWINSAPITDEVSAGFITTVLPVTSAATVMPVCIASGKFQGAITAVTPRGR